ncbi:malonate decarboxylase holo-[acyl-carrier-protein] synthase [Tatlockia micdadei]|uniref:malonate decarboxylase holo-[acyl-carrier-protein] synthase n=1 Tax=Legionella micdadei TaxID=451 RepID=UPI0015703F8B|nr:malonate decarboxylase holo-[acyl-carrier-protein] synthase [Legionella micdadei]NSL18755.1 malonate decarboxylase holo-[acyl-carrier-protein] synthase [Legionella micdadei]
MNHQRHTLCFLKEGAKPLSILQKQEDELLEYWMKHQFPLIFTYQPKELHPEHVQLAIPFFDSSSQKKIRLCTNFYKNAIKETKSLPTFQDVFQHATLKQNTEIRVYGSYCWQYLTKLNYVQPSSDLDLLIFYENQSLIELVLYYQEIKHILSIPRLDGEVRFPNLGDCSWFELIQPSSSASILLKSAQQIELISREYLYEQVPTLLA